MNKENVIDLSKREIELDFINDQNKNNKWIKEELKLIPNHQFQNKDFNKLSGLEFCIVFDLDLKESRKQLFKWIFEEIEINQKQAFSKDLMNKL